MNILNFFNIINVYYFLFVFEQFIYIIFFILIKVVKICKKVVVFLLFGRKIIESFVIILDFLEYVSYWDLMVFVFQYYIKYYLYDIEIVFCMFF